MNSEQKKAVKSIPECVELEGMDGTWEHFVYRVEHPVNLRSQGEKFYTLKEARSCQGWLKKHAPKSTYANLRLN